MRPSHIPIQFIVAATLLLGCAGEPSIDRPFAAEAAQARRLLVEAAARGPVRLDLAGIPSSLAAERAAVLAGEGVSGATVAFSPDAAAAVPRLVLAFDPPLRLDPAELCAELPPAVPATPHRLAAAFCAEGRTIAAVSGIAAGGDPADTERLVWRATARLFPDDYADSYGLNLFGSRLRVGVGGSFGF